jgi:hypothetical protein
LLTLFDSLPAAAHQTIDAILPACTREFGLAYLARDPDLLTRTFDIADVFPLGPACVREPHTAQGTPVHGTTLLHIAAYFDEIEIAEWLFEKGMDPNAPAVIDSDGFGGYIGLYSTVVSQHNFWVKLQEGEAGRCALHAPHARPRGRSELSGIVAGTP